MGNFCARHHHGVNVRDAVVGDNLEVRRVTDRWGTGNWVTEAGNPNQVVCLDHDGECWVQFARPIPGVRLPASQAQFKCVGDGFEADEFHFKGDEVICLIDLPAGTRMEVIAVGALHGEVVVTDEVLAATEHESVPAAVRVLSPPLPSERAPIQLPPAFADGMSGIRGIPPAHVVATTTSIPRRSFVTAGMVGAGDGV